MKMKINVPVRIKNPWFWVGLVGVILSAMGVSPEIFTSWNAVYAAAVGLLSNPYQLCCVVVAILGVFIDPTTSGISDSPRALGYHKPYKGK